MNLKLMKAKVLYAKMKARRRTGKSLVKMRRLLALSKIKKAA